MALTDDLKFAHFCEFTDLIASPAETWTASTPAGRNELLVSGSPTRFVLDGTSARSWLASTADAAFAPGTGDFTVAARVMIPTGHTNFTPLFQLGGTGARTVCLAVQSAVNRVFKGHDTSDPGTNYMLTTSAAYATGVACTVIMGRDSLTGFIYVDGVDKRSSGTWGRSSNRSYGGSSILGERVTFGAKSDGTSPALGEVEWLVTWHRALDSGEIAAVSAYTRDELKTALGVSGSNNAPTFDGAIADLAGTVGTLITPVDVSGEFSDSDADPLTFTQSGTWPTRAPAGDWVSAEGVISGTPSGSAGTYTGLKVIASDGLTTVDSDAFQFVVTAASGTAPTLDDVQIPLRHGETIRLTGANLEEALVTIGYSSLAIPQEVAASSAAIDIEAVNSADLPYGDVQISATTEEGTATLVVEHEPVSGFDYAIVDVPWDGQSQSIFEGGSGAVDGDQVEYAVVTNQGDAALIRGDGTLRIESDTGVHRFAARIWDESALEWGASTIITVLSADYTPSAPVFDGPDLDDLSLTPSVAVEIDATILFSDADLDIETYTLAGSWPSWLTITDGVVSGVSAVGAWSGLSIRATDSGGSSADSNAFSITVTAIPAPEPETEISDVDRIAIQNLGGSKTVNKLTGTEIRARLFDSFNNPARPHSLHWRLVDYCGRVLQDWTELTMTIVYDSQGAYTEVYADIEIAGSLNNTTLNSQQNTVIVVADKDLRSEFSRRWDYVIKRLDGR